MQWADTQKQMSRNLNCTQREKIDQSGTISATLGAYVKDFEVSFAFWAAWLWQLSCSLLSVFITFCDYWKFQTAKTFKFLIKKTKSNTMKKISLHKVIHNLQLLSHFWIVQKTELTKKPKFTSSRKNAYFEKRLTNLPRKEDVLWSWCSCIKWITSSEEHTCSIYYTRRI